MTPHRKQVAILKETYRAKQNTTPTGFRRLVSLILCLCLFLSILPSGLMTTALAARLAIARKIFTDMTKVIQCIYAGIHFKYQITTTAAVSAIRTTCSYIQFSSETHMTVSAFSGSYCYFRTICKHHILLF